MNDKEFISEVGFWGWFVTGLTMLGLFISNVLGGMATFQSFGHTLVAFVLVPFLWMALGRYSVYWRTRLTKNKIVEIVYIFFWGIFVVKLFYLGSSTPRSPYHFPFALLCGLFASYAAKRSFRRIEAGEIGGFHEFFPDWIVHLLLIFSIVIFLSV